MLAAALLAWACLAGSALGQEAAPAAEDSTQMVENLRKWKSYLETEWNSCKAASEALKAKLATAEESAAELVTAKTDLASADAQYLASTHEVAELKASLAASGREAADLKTQLAASGRESAALKQQLDAALAAVAAAERAAEALKSQLSDSALTSPLLKQAQAYIIKAEDGFNIAKKVVLAKSAEVAAQAQALADKHLPGLQEQARELYGKAAPHIEGAAAAAADALARADAELRPLLAAGLGSVPPLAPYAADPVAIQALVYAVLALPPTALLLLGLVLCCRRAPKGGARGGKDAKAPKASPKAKAAAAKVSVAQVKSAAGKPLPGRA